LTKTARILSCLVRKKKKNFSFFLLIVLIETRLEKIGFVFQTFNLLATMSAFENVALPMTILSKLNAKVRKNICFQFFCVL
jgi:ABC-type lipoprotein export system ATPase subunit